MEKKKKWIIALIVVIVLLLIVILFLLFRHKTYTITFNSVGGDSVASIKVKEGEKIELPNEPKKEGYKFAGWTNSKGMVITKDVVVDNDVILTANWISKNADTYVISYVLTDGSIYNVIVEKDKTILFPVNPVRDGYVFLGWVDEENNYITKNMFVTKALKLSAVWAKKGANTVVVKVNADNGSDIDSILMEDGKKILLPVAPSKDGYKFVSWIDSNGDEITKDTIINKNMTIKAKWVLPYTCPDECTPQGDGSKCVKESTTKMVDSNVCPSGYTEKSGMCLDFSNKYHANNISEAPFWQCNNGDYMYSEEDDAGGAFMWCVKKTNKVSSSTCPDGYTKDGNTCKKTETINCTAN